MILLLKSLLWFVIPSARHSTNLRGHEVVDSANKDIEQVQNSSYYYSTSDPAVLGAINIDVSAGNPMKGLHTSPRFTGGNTPNDTIVSTLEFYYIGLDEVMTGNNEFNWAVLDQTIADAAQRNNHVIWRVYIDYPDSPLRLPQYLIDAGVKIVPRSDGGGSPEYHDPLLETAMEQFIKALGAKYDGQKSVFAIQLGLLGKWGEWHTYPENGLIKSSTKDKVTAWYHAAFRTTRLQTREASASAKGANMGLHDDSFAYSTLGSTSWFFWPTVQKEGMTDFWKHSIMGGETRPELQGMVFEPTYVPGSDAYKQDFLECVSTTHATHMFTHAAFIKGAYTGAELDNARHAHASMGYNFVVSTVAVTYPTITHDGSSVVSVDVTVMQIGVAPFYYPLNLVLRCPGTTVTVGGVETLIEANQSKGFTFGSIPANAACLHNARIALESPFLYNDRPMKFAQGNGNVVLRLPLPPETESASSRFFVDAQTDSGPRFSLTASSTYSIESNNNMAGLPGYPGDLFRNHRWASSFTYTVSGFVPGTSYSVSMGFAETWTPACGVSRRLMNILSNDVPLVSNLDVFAECGGCNKAYMLTKTVKASANDGTIQLQFMGIVQNAMVSFIDIKMA